MEETEIQELRHVDFSDASIINITHFTGYYTYVTRLADALGVDLEKFSEENSSDNIN